MRTSPLAMLGLAAASLSLLVAATACSVSGWNDGPEGVSELSYAPRRVYVDDPYIDVTFTTTARARPGFHYVVAISVFDWGDPTCNVSHSSDSRVSGGSPNRRILGGVNKRHLVRIRPLGFDAHMRLVDDDWCAGEGEIAILLEEIGVDYSDRRSGPETLRRIEIEVEPASARPQ